MILNSCQMLIFCRVKRPGGLGAVLGFINKKQKISTLVSIEQLSPCVTYTHFLLNMTHFCLFFFNTP